jgi:molybdate transport system substrate-binding protein
MFATMPSPPLQLLSSMATRELLTELTVRYEHETGQAITATAMGGVDAARRVAAGDALDIVVLARNAIDRLATDGWLLPGSATDLVVSGVAVAVRSGAPRPDISDAAAVRAAVLAAGSIGYSTGPSGVYLEGLFERWGILQSVRHKILVPAPGVSVGSYVAGGNCELGFQQQSELVGVTGIAVLGPLPPDIQLLTIFSGAVATTARAPEAARAALAFMAGDATAAAKRRHGFAPA